MEFVYAMISSCLQSSRMLSFRTLYHKGYPHVFHLCMRYLMSPNLIYVLLVPPTKGFQSNIMPSFLSGLAGYSPQLEAVEFVGLYAMRLRVSELAPSGLISLICERQVLSCQAPEIYPCYLALLAFKNYWNSPSPQISFCTSDLDNLVVYLFNLTSSGNSVAGWVVPCGQPWNPEFAAAVYCVLHMLYNRLLTILSTTHSPSKHSLPSCASLV
ncbi:hypothetical protein BDR04DRAFT_146398 [Suillus decipiens]|nr:hypothetical protein BDR04DRAFT_146398 [Suillus decipiens]